MSGSNFGFAFPVPPGVYVSDNIARALDYQRTHTAEETFNWFYDHVRNNKLELIMSKWESMDYKQISGDYEKFGNFNYGAVAAALGISEVVATCGAGWAQQQSNGHGKYVSAALAALDILGSCGDNPEDIVQVRAGHAIGAAYSTGTPMIENAFLKSIRSSIIPGYSFDEGLITAFLHNEVSSAGGSGVISIYSRSPGNYVQVERDNLGNVVEVSNFLSNGFGWEVVVTDKIGNIRETYYQPIFAGSPDMGREPITFFPLGAEGSFIRGAASADPATLDALVKAFSSGAYWANGSPLTISTVNGGSIQAQKYFSSSYLDLPLAVETPSGWYSWDVSSLNMAAGTLVNNLLSSAGNSIAGEQLDFQINSLPTGDWRVSFSAVSGSNQSPLVQKLLATSQSGGIEEFMQWFQQRAEAMARDVLINNIVIGPGDLQTSLLVSSAGSDSDSDSDSGVPHTPVEGGSFPRIENGHRLDLPAAGPLLMGTNIAANALIESMAQWAASASDSGAYAQTDSPMHLFHEPSWVVAVGV